MFPFSSGILSSKSLTEKLTDDLINVNIKNLEHSESENLIVISKEPKLEEVSGKEEEISKNQKQESTNDNEENNTDDDMDLLNDLITVNQVTPGQDNDTFQD